MERQIAYNDKRFMPFKYKLFLNNNNNNNVYYNRNKYKV